MKLSRGQKMLLMSRQEQNLNIPQFVQRLSDNRQRTSANFSQRVAGITVANVQRLNKVEPDSIKKAKWWLFKDQTNYKTSPRTGYDITSAFVKILEKRTGDHPEVKDFVTWSDSCVPLNRYSVMVTAVSGFLRRSPSVKTVTMKYSVPRHLQVQEVDNVHSNIKRVCAVS